MKKCCCVCLGTVSSFIQGTVIFSPRLTLNETCNSCFEFIVKLHILTSSGSGIKRGFQGTVFVASCKQNADVVEIVGKVIHYSSGEALVTPLLLYKIHQAFQ